MSKPGDYLLELFAALRDGELAERFARLQYVRAIKDMLGLLPKTYHRAGFYACRNQVQAWIVEDCLAKASPSSVSPLRRWSEKHGVDLSAVDLEVQRAEHALTELVDAAVICTRCGALDEEPCDPNCDTGVV